MVSARCSRSATAVLAVLVVMAFAAGAGTAGCDCTGGAAPSCRHGGDACSADVEDEEAVLLQQSVSRTRSRVAEGDGRAGTAAAPVAQSNHAAVSGGPLAPEASWSPRAARQEDSRPSTAAAVDVRETLLGFPPLRLLADALGRGAAAPAAAAASWMAASRLSAEPRSGEAVLASAADAADALASSNMSGISEEDIRGTIWKSRAWSGKFSLQLFGKHLAVDGLSLRRMGAMFLFAYPLALMATILTMTWAVYVILSWLSADLRDTTDPPEATIPTSGSLWSPSAPNSSIFALASALPPPAKAIFSRWASFCRCVPAVLVFGSTCILVCLFYEFPQEILLLQLVLSAALMSFNCFYWAINGPVAACRLRAWDATSAATTALDPASIVPNSAVGTAKDAVQHWVILPNYQEDDEVLAATMDSIAKSTAARSGISVMLAMEEREHDARVKAEELARRFKRSFVDVRISEHPSDLPNDPAGKASNTAWAFKRLVEHLEKQGQDLSKVVLTVADADSDFHPDYFDDLRVAFEGTSLEDRDCTIWQAPVFHMKNYHRQPMAVIPSTIFAAVNEVSVMADPFVVRFPYSTYSVPVALARRVGGWDAEWIAEDWHMGLKCFLLTHGACKVQPLMCPILNYTPEGTTWSGTVVARWTQAKRHALGFSDMTYVLTILPLICMRSPERVSVTAVVSGFGYIIRLLNAHTMVGITVMFMMVSSMLKLFAAAQLILLGGNWLPATTDALGFVAGIVTYVGMGSMLAATFSFQIVYGKVETRLESGACAYSRWIFRSAVPHFLYTVLACGIFGFVHFVLLGIAVSLAAIKTMTSDTFDYEVALKPTKSIRMKT